MRNRFTLDLEQLSRIASFRHAADTVKGSTARGVLLESVGGIELIRVTATNYSILCRTTLPVREAGDLEFRLLLDTADLEAAVRVFGARSESDVDEVLIRATVVGDVLELELVEDGAQQTLDLYGGPDSPFAAYAVRSVGHVAQFPDVEPMILALDGRRRSSTPIGLNHEAFGKAASTASPHSRILAA